MMNWFKKWGIPGMAAIVLMVGISLQVVAKMRPVPGRCGGSQAQAFPQRIEIGGAHEVCTEAVVAYDHAVAGGFAVDRAEQAVRGLELEPFEAVRPELFGVARKDETAARLQNPGQFHHSSLSL